MTFAAAQLVAKLRRRGHRDACQQVQNSEKKREPVVQGMLLEMTPRGLRVSGLVEIRI